MIALTIGCSNDSNPTKSNSAVEIIPLELGNIWKYQYQTFDTSGAVLQNIVSQNTITGDTTIENNIWYYFSEDALFFSNYEDGFHTYNQYDSQNELVYKYPCNIGDKYSQWEITSIDTQITVPAGSFKCILYHFRLNTNYSYGNREVFIKPGLGRIKSIEYGLIPNQPIFKWKVSELVEYQLN
jgi:hypothetical protein